MKATKTIVRQRVEEVLTIRLMGAEFAEIRQCAAKLSWNVSDRQLWRYIAAADKLLAERLDHDREKLFNIHIAKRRALYTRALETGDLRAALAVLKDESELYGLYPPAEPAVQVDVVALSEPERVERLAALLDRARARRDGPADRLGDVRPLLVSGAA